VDYAPASKISIETGGLDAALISLRCGGDGRCELDAVPQVVYNLTQFRRGFRMIRLKIGSCLIFRRMAATTDILRPLAAPPAPSLLNRNLCLLQNMLKY
jgi:hypothetical protein